MSIEGPSGKHLRDMELDQESLEEAPVEKRPRGGHRGREVEVQQALVTRTPGESVRPAAENPPLDDRSQTLAQSPPPLITAPLTSGAHLQEEDSDGVQRPPDPEVLLPLSDNIAALQAFEFSPEGDQLRQCDISLFSATLFLLQKYLRGEIPDQLLKQAITPGYGQKIAISLSNYLVYLYDTSTGERAYDGDTARHYEKMLLAACCDFTLNNHSLNVHLENEALIRHWIQDQGAPPRGRPDQQIYEMSAFFQLSELFPYSAISLLENLFEIVGIDNLNIGLMNVFEQQHALLHDETELYTRTTQTMNASPKLQIRVNGLPLPECFQKQQIFYRQPIELNPLFVSETGADCTVTDTLNVPCLSERTLMPAPGSHYPVFLIELSEEIPGSARETLLRSEEPCSLPFLGQPSSTISIQAIICYSDTTSNSHFKYIDRVEGMLWREFSPSSIRNSIPLSTAIAPTDRPMVLLCLFEQELPPEQHNSLPDQTNDFTGSVHPSSREETTDLQPDIEPRSSIASPTPVSTPFTPSIFLTIPDLLRNVADQSSDEEPDRVTPDPGQWPLELTAQEQPDSETVMESVLPPLISTIPPSPIRRQSDFQTSDEDSVSEDMSDASSITLTTQPRLETDLSSEDGSTPYDSSPSTLSSLASSEEALPELSLAMKESLKYFQENKSQLNDIHPAKNYNKSGRARADRPIPDLPGLKPDIVAWTPSLLSYVIHTYDYDDPSDTGNAIHNPQWAKHALKVLEQESVEYQNCLGVHLGNEWETSRCIPEIVLHLKNQGIVIPPLPIVSDACHGTCDWTVPVATELLMELNPPDSTPLEPHPLIHEILRFIHSGTSPHDYAELKNRKHNASTNSFPEGLAPPQNDEFKSQQNKWTVGLVRYLAWQYKDFLQQELEHDLPENWCLSPYDQLALYPPEHPQCKEALHALVSNALFDARSQSDFLTMMNGKLIGLKPNQLPWCPMVDPAWSVSTLNRLAGHFNLKNPTTSADLHKELIKEALAATPQPRLTNLTTRLNKQMKKSADFKPPFIEGMESPPESWSNPLVKVVAKQITGARVTEHFEPKAMDYLYLFKPDSKLYIDNLKEYMQDYINRSPQCSFHGLLDHLNNPSALQVKTQIRTPKTSGLKPEEQGIYPWTRALLEQVIRDFHLDNAPVTESNPMREVLKAHLKNPPASSVKSTTGYLNLSDVPIPDELKEWLDPELELKWDSRLTRVAIALLLHTTPEEQEQLPYDYRVKKKDINHWVNISRHDDLPPHMQF